MRISSVLLSASAAVNASAAFLSSNVVVPSLRMASNLKAKGLQQAHLELDAKYWKQVDATVATREFLREQEAKVAALNDYRRDAIRAVKRFEKERVL